MSFYDEISDDYEEITSQNNRQRSASKFCERFIDLTGPTSLLDAGCGSGLYALNFASMGLGVIGEDISESLLAIAKRRAIAEKLNINWLLCPFDQLPQHVTERIDAVVCMGNSLVHVLENDDLAKVFDSFSKILNPGGWLAVQILNYDLILKQRERIVGVSRVDNKEFIRFYDFLDGLLRFNILTINFSDNDYSTHLSSTLHRPYLPDDLSQACMKAGFDEPMRFGDLELGDFNPTESSSLILIARKR